MLENDKRKVCSAEKRAAIGLSRRQTKHRRQKQICKTYECKIVASRLNKQQKDDLEKLFIEGKRFYNHVLNIHKSGVNLHNINTTEIKSVIHFNKDQEQVTSELERLGSQIKLAMVQRMIANEKTIITLIKRGFQHHGNLKFKSEITSIPLIQYGSTWRFKSVNKVKIAKVHGQVLIRGWKQFPKNCEFANANLIKKANGYYLKIVTFVNKENFSEPKKNGKEIGLDFGIKTNITTSEGEKLNVSIEESERVKKLQRELSRRKKSSNNRFKTIKLLRREYLKLSNRKTDKANKIVHKFKAYDCIAMQDEQISSWHKQFGKQVQHSCMGLIKAKLKLLPQTIILDRKIPTTKLCNNCGTLNQYLTLEDRVFKCGCGYTEDRDIHAAKNMLEIKNKVFQKFNFVPTEHREITLTEFKAAAEDVSIQSKSGRRSEKIMPFRA